MSRSLRNGARGGLLCAAIAWAVSSVAAQPPVAGKFALGNPASSEEIAGWDIDVRGDVVDADLRRNLRRNCRLRTLAPQPEGFRRGVENAAAGGMKNHG